jgi:phosphoglycerate dehydrogenase-like enzyme
MLFALSRDLARADHTMKAGTWDKKSFNGCELRGKTLGLVGIGNVGSVVARCAAGVGMKVIAYDPYLSPEPRPRRKWSSSPWMTFLLAPTLSLCTHRWSLPRAIC